MNQISRRQAIQTAGTIFASASLFTACQTSTEERNDDNPTIAMLLYPEFTALDLIGPHHVFACLDGFNVELVWKTKEPVTSDLGVTITPTMTLDECPEKLAVLFVPGGTVGTVNMMQDPTVLGFLKSHEKTSDYISSVCTGSLILGAAGLLNGYRATTHWVAMSVLEDLGAIPTKGRVVEDRNRLTGGGVTAGIDFGLTLAAKLKDEQYSQWIQLVMEYSPQPPFRSGTPEEAVAELTSMTKSMFSEFTSAASNAAKSVRASN